MPAFELRFEVQLREVAEDAGHRDRTSSPSGECEIKIIVLDISISRVPLIKSYEYVSPCRI